ncbi:double-stranded RNA-binding protein 4-like isoform X2 [Neltuma alba]|nr:double-stranded RNA-binding protein 4-like isoform X2 [Prosopis alba]
MAAPRPMNMQHPSFTFKMPHSAQPSSSLSSAQRGAPFPAPSSSAPGPSTSAQLTSPGPSIPEHLMHKNRLQEYAQRANMPLPVYQTVNEGVAHAPKFRSTVCVDGKCYTSKDVFSVRKAAEQDAAKLAYEQIVSKIKDEGLPDIFEKTMVFKSILNEFAAKMNLDKVTYHTVQQKGNPFFVSSLVFNGKSYTGDPARTKKEAEQLAARTAILSNLTDSRSGIRLSEVIKSKLKFYAAINNVKGSQRASTVSHIANSGCVSVNAASVTVNNNENSNRFEVTLPECSSRGLQQEYWMSKLEKCPEDSKLSNLSQQAGEPQHIDDSSSLKKRKKNKKKANKKSRMDSV